LRVEAGYNQLCEAPRSLAMADAEAVAVWRLKHELALAPPPGRWLPEPLLGLLLASLVVCASGAGLMAVQDSSTSLLRGR
jgi:hypothetical protein